MNRTEFRFPATTGSRGQGGETL